MDMDEAVQARIDAITAALAAGDEDGLDGLGVVLCRRLATLDGDVLDQP
jgi:hypothetical protein